MKKNILAIAIASAVAAPVAMANGPTVYGQMQVEIASVDRSGDGVRDNARGVSRTELAADSSAIKMADNKRGRLGMKGSEDLGNGLKAIYQFEWQIDTPNGNITDGQRIGMVGLKGGFGTFEAGRIKVPYKYAGGVTYDPFVTTYLEARRSGGMSGGAFGHNSFWNNSVAYKNDFGNVNVWIAYGVDGGNGNDQVGNSGDLSTAVTYKANNFEVFVSTAMNADIGDVESNTTYTANKVGGQFKTGQHTISAQYEMISDESKAANAQDSTIAFLGYQMKMGATSLVAQLGQTSDDVSTNDLTYMAVGAIHRFSKKTRVFGGYRNTAKNDAADSSYTAITAGLRIDF